MPPKKADDDPSGSSCTTRAYAPATSRNAVPMCVRNVHAVTLLRLDTDTSVTSDDVEVLDELGQKLATVTNGGDLEEAPVAAISVKAVSSQVVEPVTASAPHWQSDTLRLGPGGAVTGTGWAVTVRPVQGVAFGDLPSEASVALTDTPSGPWHFAVRLSRSSVEVLEDGVVMVRTTALPGRRVDGDIRISEDDGTVTVHVQGSVLHRSVSPAPVKRLHGVVAVRNERTVEGVRAFPNEPGVRHVASQALGGVGWLPDGKDRTPWIELNVNNRVSRVEVNSAQGVTVQLDGSAAVPAGRIEGEKDTVTSVVRVNLRAPVTSPVRVTVMGPQTAVPAVPPAASLRLAKPGSTVCEVRLLQRSSAVLIGLADKDGKPLQEYVLGGPPSLLSLLGWWAGGSPRDLTRFRNDLDHGSANIPHFGGLHTTWSVSVVVQDPAPRPQTPPQVLLQTALSGASIELVGSAVVGRLRCPFGPGTADNGAASPNHLGGTQITLGRPIHHKAKWHSDERMRVGETQRDGVSFNLGKSDRLWSGMDFFVALMHGETNVAGFIVRGDHMIEVRIGESTTGPNVNFKRGSDNTLKLGFDYADRAGIRFTKDRILWYLADAQGREIALHSAPHTLRGEELHVRASQHTTRNIVPDLRWTPELPTVQAPLPRDVSTLTCTLTYDRRSLRLYLNGKLASTTSHDLGTLPPPADRLEKAVKSRIYVGRGVGGAAPATSATVRDVQIWGRTLSGSEVSDLQASQPMVKTAARWTEQGEFKTAGGLERLPEGDGHQERCLGAASQKGMRVAGSLDRGLCVGGKFLPPDRSETAASVPCRDDDQQMCGGEGVALLATLDRSASELPETVRGATEPTVAAAKTRCDAAGDACVGIRAAEPFGFQLLSSAAAQDKPTTEDDDEVIVLDDRTLIKPKHVEAATGCDPKGHFPVQLTIDRTVSCGHHGADCLYLERHEGVPYVPSETSTAPSCASGSGAVYCRSLFGSEDARHLLHWWDENGADVTGRASKLRSGTEHVKGMCRSFGFVLRRLPRDSSRRPLLTLESGERSHEGVVVNTTAAHAASCAAVARYAGSTDRSEATSATLERCAPDSPAQVHTVVEQACDAAGLVCPERRVGLPAERTSLGGWAPSADSVLLAPQRLRIELEEGGEVTQVRLQAPADLALGGVVTDFELRSGSDVALPYRHLHVASSGLAVACVNEAVVAGGPSPEPWQHVALDDGTVAFRSRRRPQLLMSVRPSGAVRCREVLDVLAPPKECRFDVLTVRKARIADAWTGQGLLEDQMEWTAFQDSEYRVEMRRRTVKDHEIAAQTEGAHVVSVLEASERDFLDRMMREATGNRTFALGGSDERKEGTWSWWDGMPWNWTSWAPGEPNNSGNEDLIDQYSGNRWNDNKGNALREAIYKRPLEVSRCAVDLDVVQERGSRMRIVDVERQMGLVERPNGQLELVRGHGGTVFETEPAETVRWACSTGCVGKVPVRALQAASASDDIQTALKSATDTTATLLALKGRPEPGTVWEPQVGSHLCALEVPERLVLRVSGARPGTDLVRDSDRHSASLALGLDAQGRVAVRGVGTQLNGLREWYPQLFGGGWQLARHLRRSSNSNKRWFPTTDRLALTQSYGAFEDDPYSGNSFGRAVAAYDEILVCSSTLNKRGLPEMWMVMRREDVAEQVGSNKPMRIVASHTSWAPYSANMYNRLAVSRDPYVSFGNHAVSNNLYAANFSTWHQGNGGVLMRKGINVFVRGGLERSGRPLVPGLDYGLGLIGGRLFSRCESVGNDVVESEDSIRPVQGREFVFNPAPLSKADHVRTAAALGWTLAVPRSATDLKTFDMLAKRRPPQPSSTWLGVVRKGGAAWKDAGGASWELKDAWDSNFPKTGDRGGSSSVLSGTRMRNDVAEGQKLPGLYERVLDREEPIAVPPVLDLRMQAPSDCVAKSVSLRCARQGKLRITVCRRQGPAIEGVPASVEGVQPRVANIMKTHVRATVDPNDNNYEDPTLGSYGFVSSNKSMKDGWRFDVDFGRVRTLAGMVTGGRRDHSTQRVEEFDVFASEDNRAWTQVSRPGGGRWKNTGSSTNLTDHFFKKDVDARFLRVVPRTYNNHPVMRFDFYLGPLKPEQTQLKLRPDGAVSGLLGTVWFPVGDGSFRDAKGRSLSKDESTTEWLVRGTDDAATHAVSSFSPPLYSKGVYGTTDVGRDTFNDLFHASTGVVRRLCHGCAPSLREVYYRRIRPAGKDWDAYGAFVETWTSKDNKINQDFTLHLTLADALRGTNPWQYCDYDDKGIAFPRNCGPKSAIGGQWNSKTRGGQASVSFSVMLPRNPVEELLWSSQAGSTWKTVGSVEVDLPAPGLHKRLPIDLKMQAGDVIGWEGTAMLCLGQGDHVGPEEQALFSVQKGGGATALGAGFKHALHVHTDGGAFRNGPQASVKFPKSIEVMHKAVRYASVDAGFESTVDTPDSKWRLFETEEDSAAPWDPTAVLCEPRNAYCTRLRSVETGRYIDPQSSTTTQEGSGRLCRLLPVGKDQTRCLVRHRRSGRLLRTSATPKGDRQGRIELVAGATAIPGPDCLMRWQAVASGDVYDLTRPLRGSKFDLVPLSWDGAGPPVTPSAVQSVVVKGGMSEVGAELYAGRVVSGQPRIDPVSHDETLVFDTAGGLASKRLLVAANVADVARVPAADVRQVSGKHKGLEVVGAGSGLDGTYVANARFLPYASGLASEERVHWSCEFRHPRAVMLQRGHTWVLLSGNAQKTPPGLLYQKYPGYYKDDLSHFDRNNNAPHMGWNPAQVVTKASSSGGSDFSLLWTGYFGDRGGTFTFRTTSDDASHLFVDGELLVDNGGLHGAQSREGTVELAAGRPHRLLVAYGQSGGGASMSLEWKGPGQAEWTSDLSKAFRSGVVAWHDHARHKWGPTEGTDPPQSGWTNPATGDPLVLSVRAVGHFEVAPETEAVHVIRPGAFVPAKNVSIWERFGLLGRTRRFSVEFDILLRSRSTGWRSFLHHGNANSNERRPAMWLSPNDSRLHVYYDAESGPWYLDSKTSIVPGVRTRVKVCFDAHEIAIYFNGALDSRLSAGQHKPPQQDRNFYSGSPWYDPPDCTLYDLTVKIPTRQPGYGLQRRCFEYGGYALRAGLVTAAAPAVHKIAGLPSDSDALTVRFTADRPGSVDSTALKGTWSGPGWTTDLALDGPAPFQLDFEVLPHAILGGDTAPLAPAAVHGEMFLYKANTGWHTRVGASQAVASQLQSWNVDNQFEQMQKANQICDQFRAYAEAFLHRRGTDFGRATVRSAGGNSNGKTFEFRREGGSYKGSLSGRNMTWSVRTCDLPERCVLNAGALSVALAGPDLVVRVPTTVDPSADTSLVLPRACPKAGEAYGVQLRVRQMWSSGNLHTLVRLSVAGGPGFEVLKDGAWVPQGAVGGTGEGFLPAHVPVGVPEGSRSYSSVWANNKIGTGHARSTLDSPQAWSSGANSVGQWLQMDLGHVQQVTGVALQRRKDSNQIVSSFRLTVSEDGAAYREVAAFDGTSVHKGTPSSRGGHPVTKALLQRPAAARYVRLYPLTWTSHMSTRADVLAVESNLTTADASVRNVRLRRQLYDVPLVDGGAGLQVGFECRRPAARLQDIQIRKGDFAGFSWARLEEAAEALGGRLPTLQEVGLVQEEYGQSHDEWVAAVDPRDGTCDWVQLGERGKARHGISNVEQYGRSSNRSGWGQAGKGANGWSGKALVWVRCGDRGCAPTVARLFCSVAGRRIVEPSGGRPHTLKLTIGTENYSEANKIVVMVCFRLQDGSHTPEQRLSGRDSNVRLRFEKGEVVHHTVEMDAPPVALRLRVLSSGDGLRVSRISLDGMALRDTVLDWLSDSGVTEVPVPSEVTKAWGAPLPERQPPKPEVDVAVTATRSGRVSLWVNGGLSASQPRGGPLKSALLKEKDVVISGVRHLRIFEGEAPNEDLAKASPQKLVLRRSGGGSPDGFFASFRLPDGSYSPEVHLGQHAVTDYNSGTISTTAWLAEKPTGVRLRTEGKPLAECNPNMTNQLMCRTGTMKAPDWNFCGTGDNRVNRLFCPKGHFRCNDGVCEGKAENCRAGVHLGKRPCDLKRPTSTWAFDQLALNGVVLDAQSRQLGEDAFEVAVPEDDDTASLTPVRVRASSGDPSPLLRDDDGTWTPAPDTASWVEVDFDRLVDLTRIRVWAPEKAPREMDVLGIDGTVARRLHRAKNQGDGKTWTVDVTPTALGAQQTFRIAVAGPLTRLVVEAKSATSKAKPSRTTLTHLVQMDSPESDADLFAAFLLADGTVSAETHVAGPGTLSGTGNVRFNASLVSLPTRLRLRTTGRRELRNLRVNGVIADDTERELGPGQGADIPIPPKAAEAAAAAACAVQPERDVAAAPLLRPDNVVRLRPVNSPRYVRTGPIPHDPSKNASWEGQPRWSLTDPNPKLRYGMWVRLHLANDHSQVLYRSNDDTNLNWLGHHLSVKRDRAIHKWRHVSFWMDFPGSSGEPIQYGSVVAFGSDPYKTPNCGWYGCRTWKWNGSNRIELRHGDNLGTHHRFVLERPSEHAPPGTFHIRCLANREKYLGVASNNRIYTNKFPTAVRIVPALAEPAVLEVMRGDQEGVFGLRSPDGALTHAHYRWMRFHSNGTMDTTNPHHAEIPSSWTWERFTADPVGHDPNVVRLRSPQHGTTMYLHEDGTLRHSKSPPKGSDVFEVSDGMGGWQRLEGCDTHEYLAVPLPRSYWVHEELARDYGAHVASVTSPEEQAALWAFAQRSRLFQYNNVKNVRLGGSDRHSEGRWYWADGSPWAFQNWLKGQPNNAGGEHGLVMRPDTGRWIDFPLDNLTYAIYKRPLPGACVRPSSAVEAVPLLSVHPASGWPSRLRSAGGSGLLSPATWTLVDPEVLPEHVRSRTEPNMPVWIRYDMGGSKTDHNPKQGPYALLRARPSRNGDLQGIGHRRTTGALQTWVVVDVRNPQFLPEAVLWRPDDHSGQDPPRDFQQQLSGTWALSRRDNRKNWYGTTFFVDEGPETAVLQVSSLPDGRLQVAQRGVVRTTSPEPVSTPAHVAVTENDDGSLVLLVNGRTVATSQASAEGPSATTPFSSDLHVQDATSVAHLQLFGARLTAAAFARLYEEIRSSRPAKRSFVHPQRLVEAAQAKKEQTLAGAQLTRNASKRLPACLVIAPGASGKYGAPLKDTAWTSEHPADAPERFDTLEEAMSRCDALGDKCVGVSSRWDEGTVRVDPTDARWVAGHGDFAGFEYRPSDHAQTVAWHRARAAQEGAELASLHSSQETDFVRYHVVWDHGKNDYWIGAHNHSGRWAWFDGSPWDYENWHANEPSGNGSGVCLYLNHGTWDDRSDRGHLKAVYKRRAGSYAPLHGNLTTDDPKDGEQPTFKGPLRLADNHYDPGANGSLRNEAGSRVLWSKPGNGSTRALDAKYTSNTWERVDKRGDRLFMGHGHALEITADGKLTPAKLGYDEVQQLRVGSYVHSPVVSTRGEPPELRSEHGSTWTPKTPSGIVLNGVLAYDPNTAALSKASSPSSRAMSGMGRGVSVHVHRRPDGGLDLLGRNVEGDHDNNWIPYWISEDLTEHGFEFDVPPHVPKKIIGSYMMVGLVAPDHEPEKMVKNPHHYFVLSAYMHVGSNVVMYAGGGTSVYENTTHNTKSTSHHANHHNRGAMLHDGHRDRKVGIRVEPTGEAHIYIEDVRGVRRIVHRSHLPSYIRWSNGSVWSGFGCDSKGVGSWKDGGRIAQIRSNGTIRSLGASWDGKTSYQWLNGRIEANFNNTKVFGVLEQPGKYRVMVNMHKPTDQFPSVSNLRLLLGASDTQQQFDASETTVLELRGAHETPTEDMQYTDPVPGLLPPTAELRRLPDVTSKVACRRHCSDDAQCAAYAFATSDCRLYKDVPGKLYVRDSAACTEETVHKCEPLKTEKSDAFSLAVKKPSKAECGTCPRTHPYAFKGGCCDVGKTPEGQPMDENTPSCQGKSVPCPAGTCRRTCPSCNECPASHPYAFGQPATPEGYDGREVYGRRCCAVDRQPDGSPLLRTSQACAGPEMPCPVLLQAPAEPPGPLRPTRVTSTSTGLRPNVDCYTGRGEAYEGFQNRAASGQACQVWRRDYPNNTGNQKGWPHNYCRNGGNGGFYGPWCYVASGADRRWESCAVPRCPTLGDTANFALHGPVPFRSDRPGAHIEAELDSPKVLTALEVQGWHKDPPRDGVRVNVWRDGAWVEVLNVPALASGSGETVRRHVTRLPATTATTRVRLLTSGPLRFRLHGQSPPQELPELPPGQDWAQIGASDDGTIDLGKPTRVYAVLLRGGGEEVATASQDGQRFSTLQFSSRSGDVATLKDPAEVEYLRGVRDVAVDTPVGGCRTLGNCGKNALGELKPGSCPTGWFKDKGRGKCRDGDGNTCVLEGAKADGDAAIPCQLVGGGVRREHATGSVCARNSIAFGGTGCTKIEDEPLSHLVARRATTTVKIPKHKASTERPLLQVRGHYKERCAVQDPSQDPKISQVRIRWPEGFFCRSMRFLRGDGSAPVPLGDASDAVHAEQLHPSRTVAVSVPFRPVNDPRVASKATPVLEPGADGVFRLPEEVKNSTLRVYGCGGTLVLIGKGKKPRVWETVRCNPNATEKLVCRDGTSGVPDWNLCATNGGDKFAARLYCPRGQVMCKDTRSCEPSPEKCPGGLQHGAEPCGGPSMGGGGGRWRTVAAEGSYVSFLRRHRKVWRGSANEAPSTGDEHFDGTECDGSFVCPPGWVTIGNNHCAEPDGRNGKRDCKGDACRKVAGPAVCRVLEDPDDYMDAEVGDQAVTGLFCASDAVQVVVRTSGGEWRPLRPRKPSAYVEFHFDAPVNVDAVEADVDVRVGDETVRALRWRSAGAYEYALAPEMATHEEHQSSAAALGAQLAVPRTPEQRSTVSSLLPKRHGGAFLGMSWRQNRWLGDDDGRPMPTSMRLLQSDPELAYDAQREASSQKNDSYAARFARLSASGSYYPSERWNAGPDGRHKGIWIPRTSDSHQWLRLRLARPAQVHGVAVNGRGIHNSQNGSANKYEVVTRVRVVAYGSRGDRREEVMDTHLDPARPEAVRWLMFTGGPVHASTVELYPVEWQGGIAMRAEAVVDVPNKDSKGGVLPGGRWKALSGRAAAVYQRPLSQQRPSRKLVAPVQGVKTVRMSMEDPYETPPRLYGSKVGDGEALLAEATWRLQEPLQVSQVASVAAEVGVSADATHLPVQFLDENGVVVSETWFRVNGGTKAAGDGGCGRGWISVSGGSEHDGTTTTSSRSLTHRTRTVSLFPAASPGRPVPVRFEGRVCDPDSGAIEWNSAFCESRHCAANASSVFRGDAWREKRSPGWIRNAFGSCGVAPEHAKDLPTHVVAGAGVQGSCRAIAPAEATVFAGRTIAVWKRGEVLGVDASTRSIRSAEGADLSVAPDGRVSVRGVEQLGGSVDVHAFVRKDKSGTSATMLKTEKCALDPIAPSASESTQYGSLDSVSLVTHPETMRLVQLGEACKTGTIYNSTTRTCDSCVRGRTANEQGTACVCADGRFTLEPLEDEEDATAQDPSKKPCQFPGDLCLDEQQYFKRKEGTTTGSCVDVPEGFMRTPDAMSYECPVGTELVDGECKSTDDSKGSDGMPGGS